MGRQVSLAATGKSGMHRQMRDIKLLGRGPRPGGRKLALCLEFAKRAMRGHAGDG